jgi:hypothetical protein
LEVGLIKIRPYNSAIRISHKNFRSNQILSVFIISVISILLPFLTGCSSSTESSLVGITPSQLAVSSTARPVTEPTTTPYPILASPTSSTAEDPDVLPSKTPTTQVSDLNATPESTSTPPVVPGLPEICQPFPSDIYGITMASNGSFLVHARCNGEDISFRSPVGRVSFHDYTPLTGRLAYSRSIMPQDHLSTGSDLWVFDFWTGQETMWLDGGVTAATWAPARDPLVNDQHLAILQESGTLAVGTEPHSFTPLEGGDNVCWFSWSPLGDHIVYVKNCSEIRDGYCYRYTAGTSYLLKIHEGQPRKLAEGTNDTPIWALEDQALIIPGSPVKIYHLDQDQSSPLSLPNGEAFDGARMRGFFWSPSNRFLFMSEYGCFDHLFFWVAELSEDLTEVINYSLDVPALNFQYLPHEEIYISSPSGRLEYLGKILSLERQSFRMSVVLTEYNDVGFGDRAVVLGEDGLIVDAQGNRTDYSALAEGMYIDFLGQALSPDTLTLVATRIHIVAPTSTEVTYLADIVWLDPETQKATIQISQPEFSIYCDQRGLALTPETQITDEKGALITFQDLQEGMSIEVVGLSLASDPISILATTVRILD